MDMIMEILGYTLGCLVVMSVLIVSTNERILDEVIEWTFSLFSSKKKRVKEATKLLASQLKVKSEELVYKENKQLQSFFRTKGQLYYHVFTPNGEYYVQFEFEGNKAVDCRIKEQSRVNVFDDTLFGDENRSFV